MQMINPFRYEDNEERAQLRASLRSNAFVNTERGLVKQGECWEKVRIPGCKILLLIVTSSLCRVLLTGLELVPRGVWDEIEKSVVDSEITVEGQEEEDRMLGTVPTEEETGEVVVDQMQQCCQNESRCQDYLILRSDETTHFSGHHCSTLSSESLD
jgi:hypothetical protein